jgi:hypothetical protein
MTPEKDKELCEKYPDIFENRYGNVRSHPISFGIECGDGWFNILDIACKQIQNHCNNAREYNNKDIKVKAVQVKEKFGTLRFYITGGDGFVNGVISTVEAFSAITCEDCGSPGKLYTTGWCVTQCESCREKYLKRMGRTDNEDE